jgi:hypothetical protein
MPPENLYAPAFCSGQTAERSRIPGVIRMRAEFLIERNGKAFCLYAGLLDEAHQQGLKSIRTTLLQIPTEQNGNVAICQSEVETERGIFTGLGDASNQNVARAMQTCLIRMAETRAKARALRDAVNVGVVAFEELDADGAGPEQGSPSSFGGGGSRGPVRISGDGPEPARARPAQREASPREASPREASSREASPREASPREASPREASPREAVRPVSSRPSGPSATDRQAAPADETPRARNERSGNAEPITPAQRRMLESLAGQVEETVSLDELTRQEASQMITEFKSRLGQARAA